MTKTILEIPPPKDNKHIFWEHTMKSVYAFVGMFALLFFGPLMMEGRRRGDKGEGPGAHFLHYMVDHPEVQFAVCAAAVIAYNIYVVFRNSPTKFVVSIRIKDDLIEVGLTNLYYKKVITKSVQLSDFYYVIDTQKVGEKEKKQTLKLIDGSTSNVIGIIKPSYFIWEKHLTQLKGAIQEMKKLELDSKIRQQ